MSSENGRLKRPEQATSAQNFYTSDEAFKYTQHAHTQEVQRKMAERAMQLIRIDDGVPRLVLDVGCGSGLSGEILSQAGHIWVGTDISEDMLDIGNQSFYRNFDLILHDMGHRLNLRPGCIDACISISALQWICYSNDNSHNPFKRLMCFFTWLKQCLSNEASACLQFYPENIDQIDVITQAAKRCGFSGGVVTDNADSKKKKKYYLVITIGTALDPTKEREVVEKEMKAKRLQKKLERRQAKKTPTRKEYILTKKERQRNRGMEGVRPDSKYTGRRRRRR